MDQTEVRMADEYRLFFLKPNDRFPEGTLFELSNDEPISLPDDGDGNPAVIDRERLIPCPDFAESVPPGQCPITATSISFGDLNSAIVDTTLHYQVIELPIPNGINEILSATVNDRVHGWQADRYETSAVEGKYRLHIGHLRPGFYEVIFELTEREPLRMTFIKFFPKQFTDRYAEIAQTEQMASGGANDPEIPIPTIAIKPHHRGDAFSDELLNYALKLTTEWGENYGKPINERILRLFPELSDDEITELTKLSREAESYIYALAERELAGEIAESAIPLLALEKFGWLDKSNRSRLTGIGMYYSRR